MASSRGTSEVTLEDIARAAGVSVSTASRVLNGSTRPVRSSNRDTVLAAAVSLGYSPDLRAQATAGRASMLVVIVVSDLTDAYCSRIASHLVRGIQDAGLTAFVTVCSSVSEARLQIRNVRGHRPRAIAMVLTRNGVESDAGVQQELREITDRGGRVILVAEDDYSLEEAVAPGLPDLVADLVRGTDTST